MKSRNYSKWLLGIINDILDFSKIEAGKIEIIPADYSLPEVINDLVNMIKTRADDKGLTLHLEFDKALPRGLFFPFHTEAEGYGQNASGGL